MRRREEADRGEFNWLGERKSRNEKRRKESKGWLEQVRKRREGEQTRKKKRELKRAGLFFVLFSKERVKAERYKRKIRKKRVRSLLSGIFGFTMG